MVVFINVIVNLIYIICLALFLLLLSSISIEVKKIEIDKAEDLKGLLKEAKKKDYSKVFNYANLKIKLTINIFGFIPLQILHLNSKKLRKKVDKMMTKRIKEKNKNKERYLEKQRKLKQRIKRYKPIVLNNYIVERYNVYVKTGIFDAGTTAMVVVFANIVLAILTVYISEEKSRKNKDFKFYEDKYKFEVKPLYDDTLSFYMKANGKVTIYIFSVLKDIIMYKYNLFVNNTNKYKVKES